MAYMTNHPVSVDGVRLDTLAWGIEAQTYSTGALRSGDLTLPGLDGVLPSMGDARAEAYLTLGMFIRGTDDDGLVPAGSDAVETLRRNLDTLLALFGQTHRLIDVREVIDAGAPGTSGTRQALGKVTDAMAPEIEVGQVARLTVVVTIPSGYWRDVDTQDWVQVVTPGAEYVVPTLTGTTGPVTDGVLVLTGPLNDAAIVDVATGHKVRLPGALPAGQTWRINSATWETRTGPTLALGSADTTGTSRAAETETVGLYPYLMPLRPAVVGGVPQVRVKVEGTGATSATVLRTRTRKAYL